MDALEFVFSCPSLANASVDIDLGAVEPFLVMETVVAFVQARDWRSACTRTPLLDFVGSETFLDASILGWATEIRDTHQDDAKALGLIEFLLSHSPLSASALLFKTQSLLLADSLVEALDCVNILVASWCGVGAPTAAGIPTSAPPLTVFKAFHFKAIILNRQGMNGLANDALRVALHFKADDLWAWTDAATIQMELKCVSEAFESIEKAIALAQQVSDAENQHLDEVWFRHALILQKLKRQDDAILSFQAAIAIADSASYRYHLGELFRKSSRLPEALVQFAAATSLQPTYLVAWNSAGLTLSAQREYPASLKLFAKALEISPKDCVVWANKGEALFMQGHYELALESFEESIKFAAETDQSHSMAFVWIRKGKALCLIGNYEAAVVCLDQALQEQPDDAIAWEWKGRALFEQGLNTESLACYNVALQLAPNDYYAWSGKAMALGTLSRAWRRH